MARGRSPVALSSSLTTLAVTLTLLAGVGSARAQEDTGPATPTFKEGDVITMDNVESLKPFLPPEIWANRDFFFYEGMKLEIGPFFRDYGPPEVYVAATKKFAGQPQIGPESSLANHTAGQPCPMEQIDCKGDPQAGSKVIWDFDSQWEGDGATSEFLYSYWDRGEQLPLYYQGTSKTIQMNRRVEPEYLDKQNGDLFRDERRKGTASNAKRDAERKDVCLNREKLGRVVMLAVGGDNR